MVVRNWRQVDEPRTRRWTREEYYRMGEMGLFQDQKVELIDGEIVQVSPQLPSHSMTIGRVENELRKAFGEGCWFRVQMPLTLERDSEPEPDLAVVPGSPDDYPNHPSTALLVVEISGTTLSFDQQYKSELYARAGIPEFWIVNLRDRRLEVYREPTADHAAFGAAYQSVEHLNEGDLITPLARLNARIRVCDLLPKK